MNTFCFGVYTVNKSRCVTNGLQIWKTNQLRCFTLNIYEQRKKLTPRMLTALSRFVNLFLMTMESLQRFIYCKQEVWAILFRKDFDTVTKDSRNKQIGTFFELILWYFMCCSLLSLHVWKWPLPSLPPYIKAIINIRHWLFCLCHSRYDSHSNTFLYNEDVLKIVLHKIGIFKYFLTTIDYVE
jgi:hypothetical protein